MIAIQDFVLRRWEPGAAAIVPMLIEPAGGDRHAACRRGVLRSPLFDLSIALKTISVILSRKNAY